MRLEVGGAVHCHRWARGAVIHHCHVVLVPARTCHSWLFVCLAIGNSTTHPPCEQVLAAMEGVLVLFWCPGGSSSSCVCVALCSVSCVEVGRGQL